MEKVPDSHLGVYNDVSQGDVPSIKSMPCGYIRIQNSANMRT